MDFGQEDIDRFLRRVEKEHSVNGCWLWIGACCNEYGIFSIRRKLIQATHFALLAFRGISVPKGQVARHTCDNPKCVNPEHLSPGTQAENMRDKVCRGRTNNGFPNAERVRPYGKRNLSGCISDLDKARFQKRCSLDSTRGCWVWSGYHDRQGYGIFSLLGRSTFAHRAAYLLFRGQITEGFLVRHCCDNPGCVNPDHLLLGTRKDNARDVLQRGRRHVKRTEKSKQLTRGEHHFSRRHPESIKRGEARVSAVLSEAQVKEIILRLPTERNMDLAREFAVCRQTISAIRCGNIWTHLPRPASVKKLIHRKILPK